ncbi:Flavin-binding monooxygenase-like protein 2 [Elsinoe fawcettii]|nr:Flavin-binding monooxygenase-like protein 2 [Elsinoe fawcettii]
MDSPQCEHNYDCIILGAGLSGVCSLYHIRDRFPNWRITIIEAGDSVGGTWYWNRYPGARFDSESLSYGFSFDKELLEEWHWKEAFSPQPETLRYIQRVAEKHDLYQNIILNTRISKAVWQQQTHTWLFTDNDNVQYRTKFFVSCIGFLSAPTLPAVPGVETFGGQSFHTSRWPKELNLDKDLAGKRIGIMGTGATGIQTITEIAKVPSIKTLTVFQRTANWSAPLRNSKISADQMDSHRAEYPALFQRCAETPMCFIHQADPRKSSEVTAEERLALWEKIYSEPGMSKWLGAFKDTYTDRKANKLYSDFMANKIRARVNDSTTAEKLIPKNHGFGTRRVPLESGYFESYNRSNVHLVDLHETPIERITETGITTEDGTHHDLDILIYATGFDAITGAFRSIEWQVKDGRPLLGDQASNAVWVDQRPRTFLGLMAPSVPNMFMVLGPHQPFGNATRTIEHAVSVVTELLQYCNNNGYTCVEPAEQAVEDWTKHVFECAQGSLANEIDSWMTGVNKNVAGKTERTVARYAGSAIEYRRRCGECKDRGWRGLVFA